MRFIVTFLCMVLIVLVAAALVVIDLIIKLLPLIIIAVVALAALRISRRRRAPATALPTPPATPCNVPDTAAFVSASQAAERESAGHYFGDAEVIDAEVICEDDHRG